MPVLGEELLFIMLGACPFASIRLDEKAKEIDLSGTTYFLIDKEVGFYDFLRNRENAVIGVRFSFFKKQKILKEVADLDYIYTNVERRYMEVFLKDYRGSSNEWSAEQAFGDDAIWLSKHGNYALQVGVRELTDADLNDLRQYDPGSSK